jgi:hypothetical protein
LRISGSPDSPDYWRKYFESCPSIHLDGVEVRHVYEADDVVGFVVVLEFNGNRPKMDWAAGAFATRRMDGVVEIAGIPAPWTTRH